MESAWFPADVDVPPVAVVEAAAPSSVIVEAAMTADVEAPPAAVVEAAAPSVVDAIAGEDVWALVTAGGSVVAWVLIDIWMIMILISIT